MLPDQHVRNQEQDAIVIGRKLTYVAVPGLIGLLLYASWHHVNFLGILGIGILVSIASLVAGGLVGFLFGIPKSSPAAPPKENKTLDQTVAGDQAQSKQSDLRRNTNIEEISDWLTKIIVGLGIYELKNIPLLLRRIADFLAPAMGNEAGSRALVLTLIVTFSCSGFMLGYLLTVLFVTKAMEGLARGLEHVAMDSKLREDAAAARLVQTVTISGGEAGLPESIKEQVLSLASRYEQERAARSPGADRTHIMEEVASEIRKLALVAYPMLGELSKSESPGQRLAATAFLQMRPDPAYVDWLSTRVVSEVPFIKYQAALALRNAVRTLPHSEHDKLKKAILDAEKALTAQKGTTSNEYAVLQEAEQELG